MCSAAIRSAWPLASVKQASIERWFAILTERQIRILRDQRKKISSRRSTLSSRLMTQWPPLRMEHDPSAAYLRPSQTQNAALQGRTSSRYAPESEASSSCLASLLTSSALPISRVSMVRVSTSPAIAGTHDEASLSPPVMEIGAIKR